MKPRPGSKVLFLTQGGDCRVFKEVNFILAAS